VIRSATGPSVRGVGRLGIETLHGRRSSVVSVVEPLPEVVPSPVDGVVPLDTHAAERMVNARIVEVRRR